MEDNFFKQEISEETRQELMARFHELAEEIRKEAKEYKA